MNRQSTREKRITQDDVIYFVVTDRFFGRDKRTVAESDTSIHGGTLDGAIEKLDYLLNLGVTAIWVTPVYENIPKAGTTEAYHYYWPQNFERIDSRLLDGTHLPTSPHIASLGVFVDTCEAKGMKVVLDMVVNHAGYGAKDRFGSGWFNNGGTGDIKGELSGLPDFNHDIPQVIDYFINNIEEWITKGKVTNIHMERGSTGQSRSPSFVSAHFLPCEGFRNFTTAPRSDLRDGKQEMIAICAEISHGTSSVRTTTRNQNSRKNTKSANGPVI